VVRALAGGALDVPRTSGTVVSEMWADIAASLDEALAHVTLADLAERQNALEASQAAIYYI
jgi:DNA-binding IscR family transcriptional regulator